MKFEGLDIGNMPKEILSGKITVVNLRYILDLMNKIYKKYLDVDMGFYLIHENGNGYSIDSIYPQHWMSGRTCWGSSDKVGVYQWVKRCIQECQVDLTEYYILKNKNTAKNIVYAEDLEKAVLNAKQCTKKNTTCVMSPAAASYGVFKKFEERGNMFKEYINNK